MVPTTSFEPVQRSHLRVTEHAIDRYIERVDPKACRMEAASAMDLIGDRATVRPRPRHWMRLTVTGSPGATFLYWAEAPGVCLLATDEVIATVFTRETCKRWQRVRLMLADRRPRDKRRGASDV